VKGKSFYHRLKFALNGLRVAFQSEASFRAEIFVAVGVISVTAWIHPPFLWLALVIIMVALVLAAELFNTALEHLLDGIHPEQADFVRVSKDCAAAAVLVFSVAAIVIFLLMLVDVYGK